MPLHHLFVFLVWLTGIGLGCDNSVSGTMDPMMATGTLNPLPAGMGGDPSGADGNGAGGNGSDGGSSGVGGTPVASGGSAGGSPVEVNFCAQVSSACEPVDTSEHLPGRVLPEIQTTVIETVRPQDIYDAFSAACGTCHRRDPSASNGGWSIKGPADVIKDELVAGVLTGVGSEAVKRILSTDPEEVMPPRRGGASGVQPPDVDTKILLETLQTWIAQGRLPAGFTRETTAVPPFFRPTEEVRLSLTNIGSCLPAAEMVGCAESAAQRLDSKFAAIRSFADLPKRLEQTDLFTFDAAVLAQHRVIGYAPTYTLFSDGAKKMRHVRVPAGQTIRYNPATKDFDIPANTRFYKTFLREVIDQDGNHAYRKIESRIIIVRPDRVGTGGVRTRQVIFGTYRWSLDEALATLVEDPYNDETPFKDLPLRHVIDELTASENGFDPDTEAGIEAALDADDARRASGYSTDEDTDLAAARTLTRGYALPGRDRCIQCHMGSSNASFILGFNPYQVDRRPEDDGGVFDGVAGADELSQLSRLIEYGVITDVPLPLPGESTVFKLEESQQPELARNDYELKAQGYMMGNCAFCHNPSGFPSVENPSLKTVLNFYPDLETDGGIFRFPLETFSPRTARGANFEARFPYITPSIFERGDGVEGGPAPKSFQYGVFGEVLVAAPWRSLLYRNVHTPFTVGHDGAIHPHMPLNVPGYDPRAPTIMGDWMLSIPAKLKDGARNERNFLGAGPSEEDPVGTDQPWVEVTAEDPSHPSYLAAANLRVEAFHRDSIWSYDDYLARCRELNGADCEDTETLAHSYIGGTAFPIDTSDVFAPEMRVSQLEQPLDLEIMIAQVRDANGANVGPATITYDDRKLPRVVGTSATGWTDFIPDRPSWVARDLTSRPGDWVPRRSTWAELFASEDAFLPAPLDLSDLTAGDRQLAQEENERKRETARRLYPVLSNFRISENLKKFALSEASEFPYGLWQQPKDGQTLPGEGPRCESRLGSAKRVRQLLAGTDKPRWLSERDALLKRRVREGKLDAAVAAELPEQLVYNQPPGEVFFTLICSNCHGREADSNSLLGTTMLELTGGRTRVANLRDGLFGAAGANRAAVFPGPTFPSEATDTMAVRYLLWMGLGGTEATIPQVVLNRVGATRPLGEDRVENPFAQATPNMLSNAVGFCQATLALGLGFDHETLGPGVPEFDARRIGRKVNLGLNESPLVAINGDAEAWVRACALDNSPPIRVVVLGECGKASPDTDCKGDAPRFIVEGAYWPDLDGTPVFPAETEFGNHKGQIVKGLAADNALPWCVKRPALEADRKHLQDTWVGGPTKRGDLPPYCPEELFDGEELFDNFKAEWLKVQPLDKPDPRRDDWATRGAMNVGASVFLYLDALAKGTLERRPPHDGCALPQGPN
jgi:mono/diheme cytochrome c family protein